MYVVPEIGPLEVADPSEGVLGNDYDRLKRPWLAELEPESLPPPDLGQISWNMDGTFTFFPGPGWSPLSQWVFRYRLAGTLLAATLVLQGAQKAQQEPLIDWAKAKPTGSVILTDNFGRIQKYKVPVRGGAEVKVWKNVGPAPPSDSATTVMG